MSPHIVSISNFRLGFVLEWEEGKEMWNSLFFMSGKVLSEEKLRVGSFLPLNELLHGLRLSVEGMSPESLLGCWRWWMVSSPPKPLELMIPLYGVNTKSTLHELCKIGKPYRSLESWQDLVFFFFILSSWTVDGNYGESTEFVSSKVCLSSPFLSFSQTN